MGAYALWVVVGGAAGAWARYRLSQALSARSGSFFPWGTLAVNGLGCLALGFLTGLQGRDLLPSALGALFATGFIGAFTTFSTFTWETWRLLEEGLWAEAAGNVGASLGLGLAAFLAGLAGAKTWP